ncbi:hypothetical protein [Lactobacillus sp.]|uniref:hypothetical protein n=1 Tax=Lactobacillus sp. TaxID=1591 RepID=UPI00258CA237|nr:hypothetical protein [Lactobacillus sp.]MCO6530466.1 hypothetical protein [Lactobacillus sp.]
MKEKSSCAMSIIDFLPYVAGILSAFLAIEKFQHSILKNDMQKYRKMWLEEIQNIEILNKEVIFLKKQIRELEDVNIELKSLNHRISKKLEEELRKRQ